MFLTKGTFQFLPKNKLPKGRKLITSRLVLKVKKDQNNNPIKYKARLVARGFMQVEGVDFIETFASTSIPPTWRILLAIAAHFDWEIEQIDFIGAFLNSDLNVDIYLELPDGFNDWVRTKGLDPKLAKYGYNQHSEQIVHLNKALYGLKQSPREWQTQLKFLLKAESYTPLVSDSAVYFNAVKKHFIVTFVDDCLLIGPNLAYIKDLKRKLNKVYALKDKGPAAYFLGVQIKRDKLNRLLWIT